MKPGRLNITEEKTGARYTLGVNLCDEADTPVDLTGYTAIFRVRYAPGSPNVLLEATTADGGITLGGNPYNLVVDVDLAIAAGHYCYDLVLVDALGKQWPILTGRFEPEASVI
jgi:hypothetical protein